MDIGTRSLMERSRDPSVAGGSRLRCAGTRQKEPSASIHLDRPGPAKGEGC